MSDEWNCEITQDQLNKLAAILTEHFGCFVLVGFDLDGNRVGLQDFNNALDYDALQQRVEDKAQDMARSQRVIVERLDGEKEIE